MAKVWKCAGVFVAVVFGVSTAHAGVPECNNLRLEDVGSCELKGSLECQGSCGDVGVFKKACATKLRTVCKNDCTLDANPTCTDQCTGICQDSCDRGENVICQHNCFGECTGSCEADCTTAADPAQCVATCEANCDGECDIKCRPLIDGDCYTHCIECCGGSCTAQANMTCQQTCQAQQFEDCEYEFRLDCQGSCSGDGALFCDGEFALSGEQIPSCVTALAAEGVVTAQAGIDVIDDIKEESSVGVGGCSSVGQKPNSSNAPWFLVGALLGAISLLRRRQRA